MKKIELALLMFLLTSVFLLATAGYGSAAGDQFPNKPINWYTHGSAGGGSDIFSRMAAMPLRKILKVPVIVQNYTGGSGARFMNHMMTLPADGYTLYTAVGTTLSTIARGMTQMKIDDLVGIAQGCYDPQSFCVPTGGRFKDIQAAVEFGKAHPRKLKFGIAQVGSDDQVSVYSFCKSAGIVPEYVPLKGGSGIVLGLLSHTIDIGVLNPSEFMGQYEVGKIKPVVFLVDKRVKGFPDVPTAKELGWTVKASKATSRGVTVRAGTPEPVMEILSKALVESMDTKLYQNYLESNAMGPDSVTGRKEYDTYLKTEYPVWKEAMGDLGLIKK